VAQYGHSGGACSITGGYVYTGGLYPNLSGKYLFSDFCNGNIVWVDSENPGEITWPQNTEMRGCRTFGEDFYGELYVAGAYDNTIYKITDTSLKVPDSFSKMDITIYPNPAHNEISVKLNNLNVPVQVTIYDLSGKHLLDQPLNSGVTHLDTTALQAGIYLIEVSTSGKKTQKKLVIN